MGALTLTISILLASLRPVQGTEATASQAGLQQPAGNQEIDKLKKEVEDLKKQVQSNSEKISIMSEASSLLQHFHMQVFSNVTGRFDNRDDPDDSVHNAFVLGQLDLYIAADLGKGFGVVNENVILTGTTDTTLVTNSQTFTVQRLYAKYKHADYLTLKLGREHTPFGYWNYEFHHGSYLQLPVERPLAQAFEAYFGILPIHTVGLEATGSVDALGGFNYSVYAGNGRGTSPTAVNNGGDNNAEKAFGARLEYTGIPDLRLGVSAYADHLSDIAGPAADFDEEIYGVHAVYSIAGFHFAAEGFALIHDGDDLSEERKIQAGYLMVGYEISPLNLTPYALGERVNYDSGDPLFGAGINRKDINQLRLGVRWDMHKYMALKVEYNHAFLRRKNGEDFDALLIDVSFGF